MKKNEFHHNLAHLQKIAYPSYVDELQKTLELLKSRLEPTQNIISEFLDHYQPIKLALPDDFGTELSKNSIAINQIADILKSSIPDLSSFHYEIEEFDDKEYEEEKVTELIDDTKFLLKSIYKENNLIDIIDPREFEKIIAELLYYKGYEVNLTKRTRDGGYDILALTKLGGIPFKLLAECKRHKNTIGIDIIRSFCDVVNYEKANKGVIFTTSYFSQPAISRKNEMGTILDLKNRDEIIQWIVDYNER